MILRWYLILSYLGLQHLEEDLKSLLSQGLEINVAKLGKYLKFNGIGGSKLRQVRAILERLCWIEYLAKGLKP